MSTDAKPPLVSVITNFLNGGSFIAEAIESVLAQTYPRVEHILVDDGSTDESTAIAEDYASRFPDRIRYVDHDGHANLGTSASRNAGFRASRGEFIAYLDADDVFLPEKLERRVAELRAHPEAAMVYGAHLYWHGWTGDPTDVARDWVWNSFGSQPGVVTAPPELVRTYLRDARTVPCPSSVVARRAAVERIGGWDDAFRSYYDDQVFYCKVALMERVLVSSACLEKYRQHPASLCAVEGSHERGLAHRKVFLDWLAEHLVRSRVLDTAIWSLLGPQLFELTFPRVRRISLRTKRWLEQRLGHR